MSRRRIAVVAGWAAMAIALIVLGTIAALAQDDPNSFDPSTVDWERVGGSIGAWVGSIVNSPLAILAGYLGLNKYGSRFLSAFRVLPRIPDDQTPAPTLAPFTPVPGSSSSDVITLVRIEEILRQILKELRHDLPDQLTGPIGEMSTDLREMEVKVDTILKEVRDRASPMRRPV